MRNKKNKGIYPWIKSIFKKQKKNPAEAVYAGPDYFRNDPEVQDVYAGPGYFGGGEEEPEEPETEETEEAEEQGPIDLVYSGPEKIDLPPPEPIMMTVYAGPEFFNGPGPDGPAGMWAPAPETPAETPRDGGEIPDGMKKCTACGSPNPENAPFCSECGTPFPKDEEE